MSMNIACWCASPRYCRPRCACASSRLNDAGEARTGDAIEARTRERQTEAAPLRLIEELGRTLICVDFDVDDLNGKLHRLAVQATLAASLRRANSRRSHSPEWDIGDIAELREFRNTQSESQVKACHAGREPEAALGDAR